MGELGVTIKQDQEKFDYFWNLYFWQILTRMLGSLAS